MESIVKGKADSGAGESTTSGPADNPFVSGASPTDLTNILSIGGGPDWVCLRTKGGPPTLQDHAFAARFRACRS